MTEATETQKSAYQQQWEAMDERARHAVKLAEMAWGFVCLLERGKTIAWIVEAFSQTPDMGFTASEVEFAIMGAMRSREEVIKSVAGQLYDRKGLVAALAEHQTEHGEISLEKLKNSAVRDNSDRDPEK